MYSVELGKYYHSNQQLCNKAWYDLPALEVIISLELLLSRQSHLVTNLGTTALQPWACQELRPTPLQALWPMTINNTMTMTKTNTTNTKTIPNTTTNTMIIGHRQHSHLIVNLGRHRLVPSSQLLSLQGSDSQSHLTRNIWWNLFKKVRYFKSYTLNFWVEYSCSNNAKSFQKTFLCNIF